MSYPSSVQMNILRLHITNHKSHEIVNCPECRVREGASNKKYVMIILISGIIKYLQLTTHTIVGVTVAAWHDGEKNAPTIRMENGGILIAFSSEGGTIRTYHYSVDKQIPNEMGCWSPAPMTGQPTTAQF